ncbi:NAD(P)-dependent oxidoreductase [Nonomuraea wenchangensis]|uniref:NAD(P)-dependent oxidoreductase n=1 Tax=Nonomuraea wenchangensis TaxID=568860 RepID=UPI00371FE821
MAAQRVAVIGLGGMGAGIARAVLRAGFPVTVFNRTPEKAGPLAAQGADVAASAAEAAEGADVVVLSLADEAAVESVLFGELLPRLRAGTSVVDTTTVSPAYARRAAERLEPAGVRRVEACVIGNPEMAAAGRLRVFTAGPTSHLDEVAGVLEAMAQEVRHLGTAGNAGVLKLALNLVLGVQTVGLAEAVAFAEAMGMDRELLLDVIGNSGWHSPVLGFRADFMRKRVYRPAGFRSALMHKDLDLVLREAKARGIGLPAVECAARRYEPLLAAGGDDDAAALVEMAAVDLGEVQAGQGTGEA